MKKLSVAEYAKRVGKNESTIRRAIQAGKLHAIKEIVNNRPVYKIPVGGEDASMHAGNAPMNDNSARVHEAELVDDLDKYSLISMEKNSFDELINKITTLSDARAETMHQSLEDTRKEYFEQKAECTKMHEEYRAKLDELKEQLMQEKVKAAQFEAEVRIKELQLAEQAKEFQNQNKQLAEKNLQLEKTIEEQLKILDEIQKELQFIKENKNPPTNKSWLEKL